MIDIMIHTLAITIANKNTLKRTPMNKRKARTLQ